ncbi:MAG: D-glycero-beta-D-manno-heptose 1-phosphate adenylyltransferase [Candidatus Acidiferrum sp.]
MAFSSYSLATSNTKSEHYQTASAQALRLPCVINYPFIKRQGSYRVDLHGVPLNPEILTLDEAILRFGREKRNGRRIVFTNGCFDLLHPGHIGSLEQARALGDVLIVGLNSDSSVRLLKGEGRPILPERERAEILAALESVDAVVIFDELTPREFIARLLPDVLVKGGDWPGDQIVGREEVEAAGGRVVSIPVVPGYSTTEMLRKIREGAPASRVEA